MHLGPPEARASLKTFRTRCRRQVDGAVWFFPPAVSLEAAAEAVREREDLLAGAQDIHWEAKGAFTGAVSAPLAAQAGAKATLVGHSERRQLFGETDEDTRKKTAAALAASLVPVLCVGETLAERDAGHTVPVVKRQLAAALGGVEGGALRRGVIAYEPGWAIGAGRHATPQDAALGHRGIPARLAAHRAGGTRGVYGGAAGPKKTPEPLPPPGR